MRVVIHHSKFYDWVPLPSDVKVTPSDIAARKVKPSADGGWLVPVTKELNTHTQVNLPEHQVLAKIIDDKTRPAGGRTLTRREAVGMYLSEHVLPNHTHRSWITKVEVHDDGPDEPLARQMLGEHVKAGNIEASDLELHVAAYLEPAPAAAHEAHLAAHFKIRAKIEKSEPVPAVTEKAEDKKGVTK